MGCLTELIRRLRAVTFFLMVTVVALVIMVIDLAVYPIVVFADPTRFLYHRLNAVLARLCLLPFVSVEIRGRENISNDRATIIVANHQSVLDAFLFAMLGHVNFKVVVKDSIRFYPGVGQCFMLAKHVTVKRGNKESGKRAMAASEDWVKRGVSVLFFPEGTRKVAGVLGDFKKGAFYVASNTSAPITPITIRGARSLMSPRGFPSMGWGKVVLNIHPAVETAGRPVDEVMEEVRRIILKDVAGEAPGDPKAIAKGVKAQ